MPTDPSLWQPITVGKLELPHRLALAPMTRNRANSDGTPNDDMVEYYSQRAGLGLLITEGTQPSDDGQGYFDTPGIYTDEHIAGWRKVADAVHAKGGALFIQLMHVGRVGHPDNTPHHRQLVAPSAIAPGVQIFTRAGMQDAPEPRELTTDEVKAVIDEYRHAAACAVAAGADGVEIHAANSYLGHQFLSPNSNVRTDEYGGSVENRSRFVVEVAKAIADEIGADRTGIRIAPGMKINGIDEGEAEDIRAQYNHLTGELAKLDLAYLHVNHFGDDELLKSIRAAWPNALLVLRAGRTREQIADYVKAGLADIAPIGKWALANPDVVERLKLDAEFNEPDVATFYGGGTKGYTDYPTLEQANA